MNEPTERQLRSACVTAQALCEMIITQGLWPALDADSLAEFKASVHATRQRCEAAIQAYDEASE